MDKLTKKKLTYLDRLIDSECEQNGVYETICSLIADGFTKEELVKMNFDGRCTIRFVGAFCTLVLSIFVQCNSSY